MLPVEIKFQSGGKLLSHSDLWRGVFLGEASRRIRRDIKLGTWNVRSLYRAGYLKAAARYRLDVVGVQEVRWDKEGTVRAGDYTGLFISLTGISELDCATTKTDMAERSISIGRESLQVFFLY